MGRTEQVKLNWQKTLSVLVIGLGTIGIVESPAMANKDKVPDSFELAQIRFRSRSNGPTPLNLRPRTHIPLPRSNYNRSRGSYHQPRYRRGRSSHRGYYRHGRSGSHRRGRFGYNDHYYPGNRRRSPRFNRGGRGTVIINPGRY